MFSCINICLVLRKVFEHEAEWNNHVWLLFLHILPYYNLILIENTVKTLNYYFSYTEFLRNEMVMYRLKIAGTDQVSLGSVPVLTVVQIIWSTDYKES